MKKRYMPVLVVCLLIVLVTLAGGAVYGINKLIPTREQMSLTDYYGQNVDGEAALVLGTEKLDQKALISGDDVYISLDVVDGYLNQRYYWDSENKKILYATPSSLTEETASDQAGGNVWLKDDQVYIHLDYIKKYTDIDVYINKDPDRVAIQYKFGNVSTVTVDKDTVIRYRGGIKSEILTKVAKNTVLRLMTEGEEWDQVATDDGYIGYIQKKKVKAADTTSYERNFKAETYTYLTMDEPVNLAWHQTTSTDANSYFADAIQNMTGVNVISPTWYSVADNSGNITSLASGEYVMQAHEKGLKVWGLVDNFNENISTTEVLSKTSSRQNLENQLVTSALKNGLDGINIDFETLSEDAGIHFLQFLRELSIQCHQNNLVLSVDNPVPENFTSHYDRAEQGKVTDYIIIMGYDEHYVGSDAGSVASLPWVEQGVKDTLTEVPEEQLKALWSILDYGLDGKEPKEDGFFRIIFDMAKPQIDANTKRKTNGSGGGRPPKTNGYEKEKPMVSDSKTNGYENRKPNVNVNVNDNANVNVNVKKENTEKKAHFMPPTLENVSGYCRENGYKVDAQRFIDFYESKGWMVGKNKMKDWRAAVRNWSRQNRREVINDEPEPTNSVQLW